MAVGIRTVRAPTVDTEYARQIIARLTGCSKIDAARTKYGHAMLKYSLEGDRIQMLGRAILTGDDRLIVWHVGLPGGLKLEKPFVEREIGGAGRGAGPLRGHEIRLDEAIKLMDQGFVLKRPPIEFPQPRLARRSDAEIEAAALANLQQEYSWEFHGKTTGGIILANDGTGSTPACRVLIKDGIARAWSFRGDIKLGPPWREGRDLATGEKSYWAPGNAFFARDSALQTRPPELVPAIATRPGPTPEQIKDKVLKMLKVVQPARPDHHHLTKGGGIALPCDGFQQFVDGVYAGSILVPMLRPRDAHKLDLCGAQLLLSAKNEVDTDKMMLRGSKLDGAMLLFPQPKIHHSGTVQFRDWMSEISRGNGNAKPIVLCEGVMTAAAVHASGAGHAICCFSSGNVANVGRWLHEHGYDQLHGVVIAADNDIGVTREGKIKSPTLPKLIALAREIDAEIAFPGKSFPVGTDARDLWRDGGAAAVQRYIERAAKPEEVERRFLSAIQARGITVERE